MAVLNVNAPFPVIVRLSVALSCRTRPVLPLAKPVSVTLMVKGPALEPGLVPLLDFLKLQPMRRTEVSIRNAGKKGFITGFISDCWLLYSYTFAKSWLQTTATHSLQPVASESIT